MVDITNKVEKIEEMVDYGYYFTINRPRQYGKTTILNTLAKKLRDGYAVIKTSFEGVSDRMFESEELFCRWIFDVFADSVEFVDGELASALRKHQKDIDSYNTLSREITDFVQEIGKGVVLLIDEVDKNSNNRTFLKFLGLLRNKYLARNSGEDFTFQSVILSGVHDIKNLKLAIRDESDTRFNSPWNIAEEFRVDMSFNKAEIESMLTDYSIDTGIQFDTSGVSGEIYNYTSGYPYLVSRICKIIDERLDKQWDLDGIQAAVKEILNEKSTLFDDVIKNIRNNGDIRRAVYNLLIKGQSITYNYDAYEKGIMYGLFAKKDGKLVMHNKIFEERIYNYLLEDEKLLEMSEGLTQMSVNQFLDQGELNMEKVLLKFQEFMYEEYRQEDERFYETHGRMIFLSFLKPILNGRGFRFVEPVTRQNKRMDLVLTFNHKQYILELKIWNGKKYEEKGINQLCEYLDIHGHNTGYLLVFNFNSSKEYKAEWINVDNKRIFEVLV
jgi:Predicted AAA-ATPase.